MIKFQPKNYSTVSLEELADFVMGNLINNEPLILKLSETNKKRLITSIMRRFGDASFINLESGGDGMINPTFMEIISFYIFRIRKNNYVDLISQEDKVFYHKYLLCFEQDCQLTYNQMNKVS